jgi:peptidoglycan glycosyltransferase
MDKQIRRLGIALVALFLVLLGQVNYLQVVAADRIANNPANTTRLLIQAANIDRGDILARDATTVLARSVPTRGQFKYQREYPQGSLYADVTGFYPLVGAPTDLEATYNDFLSGRAEELLPSTLVDQILGRPRKGATVITTIDPELQQVASDQLGDREGAVVAMDPATGELLVMVSNPTFDPNPLASHVTKEATSAFEQLQNDPEKPLLANANDQLYPPGSTFKLVTASAALEDGVRPDERIWDNPPSLDLPLTTHNLENFGGSQCPGGSQLTLAEALTISCNVVFGEVGLELGAGALADQAHGYGFSEDVPFDIRFAEGQFPDPDTMDEPTTAIAAIGQSDVNANPLQMALVGSAIANGGELMRPQLVREVRDSQGRVLRRFRPAVYDRALSSQSARDLTSMMVNVVSSGTGAAAAISGVSVAGKTGTAQHGGNLPHAWFVSFAPAEHPQIVVAVLILNGGNLGSETTGGQEAAPVAKAVMEAALRG